HGAVVFLGPAPGGARGTRCHEPGSQGSDGAGARQGQEGAHRAGRARRGAGAQSVVQGAGGCGERAGDGAVRRPLGRPSGSAPGTARRSHRRRADLRKPMSDKSGFNPHGTTILGVRRNGALALGGDGQVTLGNTVMKGNARKVRRLANDRVLAGFAGGTADAFTLFERFEGKLEKYGNLTRAAIELAK